MSCWSDTEDAPSPPLPADSCDVSVPLCTDQTHERFHHSPTTGQGRLAGAILRVTIVHADTRAVTTLRLT